RGPARRRSYAADVDVASVGVAEVVSHGHELLRPLLRAALDPDGGPRRGKMVLERGFPTDSNPSRHPAPATACATLRRAPVTSSPRSRCRPPGGRTGWCGVRARSDTSNRVAPSPAAWRRG